MFHGTDAAFPQPPPLASPGRLSSLTAAALNARLLIQANVG